MNMHGMNNIKFTKIYILLTMHHVVILGK